jgi:hypothetical protein
MKFEFDHDVRLRTYIRTGDISIASQSQSIYKQLLTSGPPIEFQTASPGTNFTTAFALGINTYHATELEVWDTKAAGGSANITTAQLQGWASQFVCH